MVSGLTGAALSRGRRPPVRIVAVADFWSERGMGVIRASAADVGSISASESGINAAVACLDN